MLIYVATRSIGEFAGGRCRGQIAVTTGYYAAEGGEVDLCGEGAGNKAKECKHRSHYLLFGDCEWKMWDEEIDSR